ncbi:MAG: DUF1573 domain-containing protein [Planctomycetes bacterium]|nr:DUF1573 domain-containing protein [Planctomycetota bacterium]
MTRFAQQTIALGLSAWLALLGASVAKGQAADWAEKMFEARSHDFGVVARGSDVRYRFKLKNIYQQTVHIASVQKTCGCTEARISKTTLQPGETAYIEVEMDTRRFIHRKDSNVIVTFDAPYYAQVYLPITAYIRTDVVVTPGSANFGTVEQGKSSQVKLDVAYAGRHDWKILRVEPDSEHVEARAVETRREGMYVNYDLIVTLKPTAPPGLFRSQIILVTDDQNGSRVPVLVEARIEAEYTVMPAVVSLGILHPGERKMVNVVVKGRKPFKIEKIECEVGEPTFKVRLPKTAQTVHVLPLTVVAPEKPGTISETFTLTIAGESAAVTFKVYGKIAGPGT